MPTYTLLEIVQKILSDMDSEEVNSIGETSESSQIASIVEDTYYNIVYNRLIPEHSEPMKLTSVSDGSLPTHFLYPTNAKSITLVEYDNSSDASFEYSEVHFLHPVDFLNRIRGIKSDYDSVTEPVSGTNLRIANNRMPKFYTSFDDKYIVMDSYDSTIDSVLQTGKTRAMGVKIPTFSIADDFVPDIDHNYFPLLINESKSVAMSILKGAPDPKVEQAARRQRSRIQNDLYNTVRKRSISSYGRR
jgi:hypothetical protein